MAAAACLLDVSLSSDRSSGDVSQSANQHFFWPFPVITRTHPWLITSSFLNVRRHHQSTSTTAVGTPHRRASVTHIRHSGAQGSVDTLSSPTVGSDGGQQWTTATALKTHKRFFYLWHLIPASFEKCLEIQVEECINQKVTE